MTSAIRSGIYLEEIHLEDTRRYTRSASNYTYDVDTPTLHFEADLNLESLGSLHFEGDLSISKPSLLHGALVLCALLTLALLTFTDVICDRGAAPCPPSSRPSTPTSSAAMSKLVLEFCCPSSCSSPSARCSRWLRSSPIVGRASRAWRGGRQGRRGRAAARPHSACAGSRSMGADRRSARLSTKKEWSASGQPYRGLQGSGWGQPVSSMHRCAELPCGPQAPESTRSCDK